jgi:hypothetical protein
LLDAVDLDLLQLFDAQRRDDPAALRHDGAGGVAAERPWERMHWVGGICGMCGVPMPATAIRAMKTNPIGRIASSWSLCVHFVASRRRPTCHRSLQPFRPCGNGDPCLRRDTMRR